MKKCNFSKIMLVFALVVASLSTYAQNDGGEVVKTEINTPAKPNFSKYLYLSADLGSGILDGDNDGIKLGFNGHLGVGFQFSKWMGVKLNLGYGNLDGKFNLNSEVVTISKLNYFDANINVTFSLMNIIFGFNPERKFDAIPHVGIGQIQYRLVNHFNRYGYEDKGIGGRKIVASVPLGIELNYSLNNKWFLFLDFTANYADSDIIEGLPINDNNDWFHAISIGANYKIKTFKSKERPENLIKAPTSPCSNYWYMAVDGGVSLLFADNKVYSNTLESNINIGVGYNFGDYFRVYGRIGNGKISGEDKDQQWSISDVNYLQASINLSTDVIGLIAQTTDKRFELYPHVGIGQLFRATTYVHYQDREELSIGEDILLFPVGIEFAYNVTDRTDLYADATTYFSQSDLLDCIKSGKNNDAYSTFNIGLRYKFNKSCIEPEECVTPEEVKDAIQKALEQQKAEEEQQEGNKPACVTPEELQQAIKEAIEEYEANRPKVDEKYGQLSQATVINNNFSDISFPKNGAQKLRTQTHIGAINSASLQVNGGSAVNRVIIEGYASPEGDKGFNERLARQRAEQAAKLIQNELGEIDAERIEITTKGADWEGLYASLENSDIEDKDSIIEQLKNSSNPEETLQEILKSHPQIKQLLPQLRRASIVITTVK
ncbi:MAG: outer membrane beta-barrel protein [Bacteroidales bacterium]|nr:outer membrane beta-barrel protein [Bacteroidales bacterium]